MTLLPARCQVFGLYPPTIYYYPPTVSLFLQSLKLRIPYFHLGTSKRCSKKKNEIQINWKFIYGSFNGTSYNANGYLLQFTLEYSLSLLACSQVTTSSFDILTFAHPL